MASTKLQRTFTTDHGNVYKWTYSFWVKRSKISSGDHAITAVTYSGAYQSRISFKSDDKLEIYDYRNNSYILQKKTNRKFRDTSAWYHIVVSNDNTQASADDRTKIYINGVQETSFGTNNQYSQNQKTSFNDDYPNYIGSYGSGDYFDGSMSHFHFIDGTAYAPTEFGETDSTTGEWKIKTNVSVTYGTNGFFILKDGNSVTDQSGNSNNFTVGGGTLTKTEDSPSNVFATLNPLVYHNTSYGLPHYQHGNTRLSWQNGESHFMKAWSTLGANKGKYYFECKNYSTTNFSTIGIGDATGASSSNGYIGQGSDGAYTYGYYSDNGNYFNNGSSTAYGNAWDSSGAVAGCAVDLDNNKLYFSVNGVWQNSGDPTSGSTGTGAISIADPSTVNGGFYMFGVSRPNVGSNGYIDVNFGNGYWGSTQISSAGTNASGIGIFEYDVPTGYTALSTKGLNL